VHAASPSASSSSLSQLWLAILVTLLAAVAAAATAALDSHCFFGAAILEPGEENNKGRFVPVH
jgi:hypothetical protein